MAVLLFAYYITYARHYNPRFVYFLPTFWSPKTFLRGFFLKILALCMVSIQERFLIKSGLWWRVYGMYLSCKAIASCISSFTSIHSISGGSNESLTTIGHSSKTSDPTTWVKFPGKSSWISGFCATLLPVIETVKKQK